LNGSGKPLNPEDLDWLEAYEAAHKGGPAFGASQTKRLVHVEEESQAVGVGDAAAIAAAAAASASREEGRRLDYLLAAGADALVKAAHLHEKMAAALLQRAIADGETIRQLTDAVRTHALTSAQLEANKLIDDAEREAEATGDDGMSKVVEQLLPHILKRLEGKK
jgi:hypothetical protein